MTRVTTQLAVFLKNVPGALRDMLDSLVSAGINVEGIMISEAADHAVVRLVVNAPTRAIHILGDRGAVVVESDILAHELANRPGELLDLAGMLSRNRINISYLYGSTPRGGGKPRLFIHTSDDRRVLRLLGKGRRAKRTRSSRTPRRR